MKEESINSPPFKFYILAAQLIRSFNQIYGKYNKFSKRIYVYVKKVHNDEMNHYVVVMDKFQAILHNENNKRMDFVKIKELLAHLRLVKLHKLFNHGKLIQLSLRKTHSYLNNEF